MSVPPEPSDATPPSSPSGHLLRFVAGRDVHCPSCEYNVRDLQNDRCPECGERLEQLLR
jgi:hypothetical protein